jgi:molybdopterin/thiamine biosynthesis adenylyltransferase
MNWIESHIETLVALTGVPENIARRLFLRPVRVEINPRIKANRTYQLAYTTAINLLSRIFPAVNFHALPGGVPAITPWGKFEATQHEFQQDLIIAIGGAAESDKLPLILENWKVMVGSNKPARVSEPWNPILAIIGAAYIVSAATNLLLDGAILGAKNWPEFSILDFQHGSAAYDFDKPISIGDLHVAGVGAVGTAFLYCLLAHGRCQGKLQLIDNDKVDYKNLGRYPLFDRYDTDTHKALAAQKRLNGQKGLQVIYNVEIFQEYLKKHRRANPKFKIENLISAPDKRVTRRIFQHELPRRVWDASTGPDQVVIHTNDYNPNFACLECIYPEHPSESAHLEHVAETLGLDIEILKKAEPIKLPEARLIIARYPHLRLPDLMGRDYDSVFRELCGASQLRAGDEVVQAPMSFVSMLAGAFLYLEFLKSMTPENFREIPQVNYYQLNPLFPPNPYMRELRKARAACTCQRPLFRNAYNAIWGLSES